MKTAHQRNFCQMKRTLESTSGKIETKSRLWSLLDFVTLWHVKGSAGSNCHARCRQSTGNIRQCRSKNKQNSLKCFHNALICFTMLQNSWQWRGTVESWNSISRYKLAERFMGECYERIIYSRREDLIHLISY